MIVPRRLTQRSFATIVLATVAIVYLFRSTPSYTYNTVGYPPGRLRADRKHAGYAQEVQLSQILAHQPGFTVIQNLYYENHTFYIVTDQPWTVPDVDLISIRPSGKRNGATSDDKEIKVLAVRGDFVAPNGDERRDLGATVSLEDAAKLTSRAEDLPSPMLINNDDDFVAHYYHWIGEIFLGSWRIWQHYGFRTGIRLPDFKAIAFRHMFNVDETPEWAGFAEQWDDHAGANRFFMNKWFPEATIETKPDWDARADKGQIYRIPMAVMSSRWSGHRGPASGGKPWGDVLRMPVADDYLLDLRQRVLKDYRGPVSLKASKVPRVRYLERQDTTRRLTDEAHQTLIDALHQLEAEGLIQFDMIRFTDGYSFEDQLAYMASTDILVAVHGNGLTHSLWLNSGPCSAVFEMQPKECSLNDFSPLATAAGVTHYLVRESSLCTPLECPPRGCDDSIDVRGPNREDMNVEPEVIAEQIRLIVSTCKGGA